LSVFTKFVKKIQVLLNLTRITVTLHEELCAFIILTVFFLA